jgi:hypothetical protein
MRRIRLAVAAAAAIAAMAVGAPGAAFAVGGPNEAGNSGHFHPKKNACESDNDHPHCPGPH